MSCWNASLFFPIHALPLTKGQCVYVFKEKDAVCVVSMLVSCLLDVSWILLRNAMLNANGDEDATWGRLYEVFFERRLKECLRIESVLLSTSPVFLTMRIKTNSFQIFPSTQQTIEFIFISLQKDQEKLPWLQSIHCLKFSCVFQRPSY